MSDQSIHEVRSNIAEEMDRQLLDILVNGEEKAIPTDKGIETVRVTPSAAMLNVIRNRVKDLKIQSPIGSGRAQDELLAEARKRFKFTGNMPELDLEGDDAATG